MNKKIQQILNRAKIEALGIFYGLIVPWFNSYSPNAQFLIVLLICLIVLMILGAIL